MLVPRSSVFLGMLIEEVFITSNKRILKTSHNYSVLKSMEKFELYHLHSFSSDGLPIIAATFAQLLLPGSKFKG